MLAQSSDAQCCQALAETYRKIGVANTDDTAAGIPVLEKALKDAKVSLPASLMKGREPI